MIPASTRSKLFPYTTLFRSRLLLTITNGVRTDTTVTACNNFTWNRNGQTYNTSGTHDYTFVNGTCTDTVRLLLTITKDRKSTRLNSSHTVISYAVFCLKKKN